MGVALNFSGPGEAESATMTLASGELARVRFTNVAGSASLRMKVVAGSVTTFIQIEDDEIWNSPALTGDTLSVVYNGQGNPASVAAGTLENIAL